MSSVSIVHSDLTKKEYPIDDTNPLPTTLAPGTSSIGNIYVVPPFTFTLEYSGNQTNVDILTPTSGKRLQILGLVITTDDSTFVFTLDFATSTKTVFKAFTSDDLGDLPTMNVFGNVDEPLRLNVSDTVGQDWFVLVNYAEID